MFKHRFVIFAILFLLIQSVTPFFVQASEGGSNGRRVTNSEKPLFSMKIFERKVFGRFNKPLRPNPVTGNFYDFLLSWQNVSQGKPIFMIEKTTQPELVEPIRLTFAGDAMMDWSVKETVKQKGPDYPFIQIKEELASSDLGVVNLETAITTGGTKQAKQYTFRSDPTALAGLKNAGFQLVSLANNHSLDYGQTGLTDTIASLRQYQLDYIGGGLNQEEAYTAKTYRIKGKTVKILAFSRVLPDYSWVATVTRPGLANGYDLNLIQSTIQEEKTDTDLLFVFIHWGIETKRSPEAFQREWAKKMIDSGADGIIGSHPHVLQGFEYYKGKPIAYSLGNFLFPNYIKGNAAQTGVLHLDIDKEKIKMTFVPYQISRDQIVKQSDNEKMRVWNELQGLSFGDLQIQNGLIQENQTVAENDN